MTSMTLLQIKSWDFEWIKVRHVSRDWNTMLVEVGMQDQTSSKIGKETSSAGKCDAVKL